MQQEVHILQSAFGAENAYGPVVINTTTKAGGTQFHGEGIISVRNFELNANDSSNNAKGRRSDGSLVAWRPENELRLPRRQYRRTGYDPGTRFNKNRDKLFFFSGYEYFMQHLNTRLPSRPWCPTAAMRAGDYSPAEMARLDPASGVGGGIKPVNLVAVSGRHHPGVAVRQGWPDPDQPAADAERGSVHHRRLQLRGAGRRSHQNAWQMVHRVDYSISDATKLFVRYYHQQEVQEFPISLWGGASGVTAVPYPTKVLGLNHSESLVVNLTHVFSPSLTNEFVGAYTYIGFPNYLENPKKAMRSTYGYPYHGVFNNGDLFIPNITATGLVGMGQNGGFDIAQKYNGNYFANKPLVSIGDNVVKIWSTHTIRIGSYNEYYGNIQPSGSFAQGAITTAANNPTGSGNPLADLLLGNVVQLPAGQFQSQSAASAQLSSKATSRTAGRQPKRLTVNYGMRIQHDPFGKDQNNIGHAVFIPSQWKNDPNVYLPGFAWTARDPSITNEGYATRAALLLATFRLCL